MNSIASFLYFMLLVFLIRVEFVKCAPEKRFLTGGFAQGVIKGVVRDPRVTEASGCAASRTHPGLLYTLNDSGGKNEVYVLATNGTLVATYDIKGSTNHDWEDIAVGPCDDSNRTADCIYIADTGNTGSSNTVYRVEEPYFVEDRDIYVEAELRFSWQEDDCETLMVDPNANVYIITKASHGHGTLYHLPNSAWSRPGSHAKRVPIYSSVHVQAPSGNHDPVGGDISPNGNDVLVKTHHAIYFWNTNGSPHYESILASPGTQVPYTQEQQGESVCWDSKGRGYYTLSEGSDQPIYYYART